MKLRPGAFSHVACQLLSFKGHIFIFDSRLLLCMCLLLASKEMRFEIMHCLNLLPSRRKQWQPAPDLAWKIPWPEEPRRLQSMGSLRVGHD